MHGTVTLHRHLTLGVRHLRLRFLDELPEGVDVHATEEFTVADILMTHVISAGSTDQTLLEPYAHVRSYLARCMDRAAWKRTLDAYSKRVEAA